MRVSRTEPCVPKEPGTIQRIMAVLEDIKGAWASIENKQQCLVSPRHMSPQNAGSTEKKPEARDTARSPVSMAMH